MAHQGKFDLVCERLRALLSTDTLPAAARKPAEGLLRQLETPVRIALVGPRDGRRAEILNGLLGQEVVPDFDARPTLELRFGETDSTIATHADGRKTRIDDVSGGVGADVLFLSLTRNVPLLKRSCFLDLVTDGSPAEMSMALKWASNRADVFVWCSHAFEGAERAVWRTIDSRFMDHAFLAVCGEGAAARATALKDDLSGEFLDVVGLDLDMEPGTADPGIARLSNRLGRHLELGRQADTDLALMFLKKYETAFEVPGDEPEAPAQAQAQPVAAAADTSGGEQEVAAKAAMSALCQQGAALIRERARQLLRTLGSDGAQPAAEIMCHCRETIEHLTEMLDTSGGDAARGMSELSDRLMEAEELLVLLEIEGEGSPEIDGVCLMLQIRREFEARAAA